MCHLAAWFYLFPQWLFQWLSCLKPMLFFCLKWKSTVHLGRRCFWCGLPSGFLTLLISVPCKNIHGFWARYEKEGTNSWLLMTRCLVVHSLPNWLMSLPVPDIPGFISSAARPEEELNFSDFSVDFWITIGFISHSYSHMHPVLFSGKFFSPLFSPPQCHQCLVSAFLLYPENRETALLFAKPWVIGFLLPMIF